jgi:hypothetical protein
MAEVTRTAIAFALAATVAGCGLVTGEAAENPPQGQGPTVPKPITPEQKATAAPSNPDAAVLAEFNARLDNYVKKQRALLKGEPVAEDATPAQIQARQTTLANELRNIRKGAKQGDIFTPQVAAMFKRLLAPELKSGTREAQQTKEQIKEDGPKAVQLTVNATYPADQPLSTVPPNLLANLPQLPKDVEYRIVGKHLMLRDVDANIIVDFIYNALP